MHSAFVSMCTIERIPVKWKRLARNVRVLPPPPSTPLQRARRVRSVEIPAIGSYLARAATPETIISGDFGGVRLPETSSFGASMLNRCGFGKCAIQNTG